MEFREFLSLTDAEVKQLATDMFGAKKVTCVKRSKKNGMRSPARFTLSGKAIRTPVKMILS